MVLSLIENRKSETLWGKVMNSFLAEEIVSSRKKPPGKVVVGVPTIRER